MGEKKKIIFIIDVLGVGGAERMLNAIIIKLAQDFKIRICVFREKDGNPIAKEIHSLGIPVDFLSIQRLKDVTALPRLLRYLMVQKPDLIHTQLEFADILGSIAARVLNIPAVATVHIIPPDIRTGKRYFHVKFWLRALRTISTHIISVSREVRQFYIDNCGIRPGKITTIYNGIDWGKYTLDRQNEAQKLRQKLEIPSESQVLLTVAILRPQKGIHIMIRALTTILQTHPNVIYLVVGDGPEMGNLKEEARKNGVESQVKFVGMQTDIPLYLSVGDIFVLPTFTEALPTVLVEAMAARLPIIASAVGGIPEMVTHDYNGLLVSPGDVDQLVNSCRILLDSRERQVEMGDQGWHFAHKKFNLDMQVDQLKIFYLKCMA